MISHIEETAMFSSAEALKHVPNLKHAASERNGERFVLEKEKGVSAAALQDLRRNLNVNIMAAEGKRRKYLGVTVLDK